MARRIQVTVLTLFFLIAPLARAQSNPSGILVSYSFEEEDLATGPDTFAVFQKSKGTVNLTTAYRFSGYRSIEIRDVEGDGEFPELQGYFVLRESGRLYFHFAFMSATPTETLNIALAGPAWFSLRKNGIGFWLQTGDGFLYHVSDSMPKRLFPLDAFIWYIVDVAYDIEAGTYDLMIHEERSDTPVVSLTNQKNASNQPFSTIDKFSFIGDKGEDTSNVVYYVDDVVIGTDEAIVQQPFVAPGRRKLFIDSWNDYYRYLYTKPGIPIAELIDVGITTREIDLLKQEGLIKLVEQMMAEKKPATEFPQNISPQSTKLLRGISLWRAGSFELERGNTTEALNHFEHAVALVPEGRIYELSAVLALAALGRWKETDERLARIYPLWQNDQRLAMISAFIGITRNNLEDAENWLRSPAEQIPEEFGNEHIRRLWSGQINQALINHLRDQFPLEWRKYIEDKLIADQYYFVLLWRRRFNEAIDYASRMIERLEYLKLPTHEWLERAGDAVFYAGNSQEALVWYQRSLKANQDSTSVILKLSDVYFSLGDLENEQVYREKIYGSLCKG